MQQCSKTIAKAKDQNALGLEETHEELLKLSGTILVAAKNEICDTGRIPNNWLKKSNTVQIITQLV